MGPKKKKQPKNAFYFFMCDWKVEKEDEGRRFPGGLKDVAQQCTEDWEYLPSNLKNKYKKMEEQAKEFDKSDKSNKFTSTGKSFQEMEDEQRASNEFHTKMRLEIKSTMDKLLSNFELLKTHSFYFIHTNVYIYWGELKKWVPCEVAVSKFSLLEGLQDVYHVFPGVIDIKKDLYTVVKYLPMGYKLESKQKRESIHHIPDPDEFDRIEMDYKKIAKDFNRFLLPHGGKELPPLYTMCDDFNTNNNMSAVRDFLRDLTVFSETDYRVYSLSLLFLNLYNTCTQAAEEMFPNMDIIPFPTEAVALQQLERDIYNFFNNLACDFHEDSDGYPNCSMSFVKRWVFLICEFCCDYLNVELVPGLHCPLTAKPSYGKGSTGKKTVSTPVTEISRPVQRAPAPRPAAPAPRPAAPAPRPAAPAPRPAAPAPRPAAPVSVPRVTSAPAAGAPPVQNVWGRGMKIAMPEVVADMEKLGYEERKPGQMKQPAYPILGRGVASSPIVMIDHSKVVDPAETRTYKTGQSPNVVSEVFPDPDKKDSVPSLRLPTSRGRGEWMAIAMGNNVRPSQTLSSDDFPLLDQPRSTSTARPTYVAGAWGRGMPTGPRT